MPDTTAEVETEQQGEEAEVETTEGAEQEQQVDEIDYKDRSIGHRKVIRDLERKLAEANDRAADKDRTPDEQALEAARREARTEATTAANARILRSEIRAAAAGKLADPADAHRFLDLDQFEVNDDGEVEGVEDAIAQLIKDKPYLAAEKPARFEGHGDGGKPPKPSLSADDWFRQSLGR